MSETTTERAHRFTDALHALDRDDDGALDAMVELFAEDAELANAALDLSGERHRGRDGARAFWSAYRAQFAQAETEFHQVTANDEAAGLFWTTRGQSPEGDALDYHGASLVVFDGNGLVASFRGYYDTRQLVIEKSAPG